MKPERLAPARAALEAEPEAIGTGVLDPEALWSTLRATGLGPLDTAIQLGRLGDPSASSFARPRYVEALKVEGFPLHVGLKLIVRAFPDVPLQHIPEALEWARAEIRATALEVEGAALLREILVKLQACSQPFLWKAWEGVTDLTVSGTLNFAYIHDFKLLPDGLWVRGGDLFLNCADLRHLPACLHVEGDLDLRGCLRWDRKIPGDCQIDGLIHCNAHPEGIRLEEWRAGS